MQQGNRKMYVASGHVMCVQVVWCMTGSGPCVLTLILYQVKQHVSHSVSTFFYHFYGIIKKKKISLISFQNRSPLMMWMTPPKRRASTGSLKSPPSESLSLDCIFSEEFWTLFHVSISVFQIFQWNIILQTKLFLCLLYRNHWFRLKKTCTTTWKWLCLRIKIKGHFLAKKV